MYLLKNVLWPLFENKIHLPQGHLSTTLLHNKLVNNLTKNLYFFPTPKFWNPYFFPVFSEKFLIVVMNVIFLFTFLLSIKSIGWEEMFFVKILENEGLNIKHFWCEMRWTASNLRVTL